MSLSTVQLHHVPTPHTAFVGRHRDVAAIRQRLVDPYCHLLTCIGPGGIGKTRLAIETLQNLSYVDFPHGVFYVPLAPINNADNILPAIIDSLSIHTRGDNNPRDTLLTFLRERQLLLVMDNFEHVLGGSQLIADIIHQAPQVTILATSREPLGLQAEHLWEIDGLRYPDSRDPDDINQFDAINLFIERALQIRRDFSPSKEQHQIITICQLVDGMPLAIELAASWLKKLSCADIIKQLQRGLDILSTGAPDVPARHRDIHRVFDHSWQLLTSDEQRVFPQLSVFRGGFTLDAGIQMADANVITLTGLVEKSMIRHLSNGRYDIHELLRQYAHEKLAEQGHISDVNQRHLDYFVQFMVDAVPDLQGKRQIERLNEIHDDFDNVVSAWEFATTYHMIDKLDAMLEGTLIYFELIRQRPISIDMYRTTLSTLSVTSNASKAFYIKLQIHYWYLLFRQRGNQFARRFPEQLDYYTHYVRDTGDDLSLMLCEIILNLTPPHVFKRPPDIDKLLRISRRLGKYYEGWGLDQICYYYTILLNENSEQTLFYLHEFLDVTESINDVNGIATAYSHLAQHTRFWGDIDDAIAYYNHALEGFRKANNVQATAVFQNLKIFMNLKKGNFNRVLSNLPAGMDELTNFGFFANHRFMHMILAKAEILTRNLEQGRKILSKIDTLPFDHRPRTNFHIQEANAMYAIALKDTKALRQTLTHALEVNTDVIAVRLFLDFLILAVFLYEYDGKPIQAIETASLVLNHPLTTTGWMHCWSLLTDMLDTLENTYDRKQFESAWERGKQIEPETAVNDLRNHLGMSKPPQTNTQPLLEPLTSRELDILQLISQGYTNEGIADQLIIAVGTVKSHTNKIYKKLDVHSRTQAVLKANELGILTN